MVNNEMFNINLNKYEYFMNHIILNNNESYINLSPLFSPIKFEKNITLDLYTYSLNDFEIVLKTNPFYTSSDDNVVDFPYPKYQEIIQITTELFPNLEYISEWNLNRFFSLDTFKVDNNIQEYDEQYQLVKIFDDDKKKIQFRKLTEDLNNFILNKYNMDEEEIQTHGKFLDDYEYNFKYLFSEIKKFDFDNFIVKEDGDITTFNKESLKEELYKRIKQNISFDFVINKNNIKLNMVFERKNKSRKSLNDVTYLFTFFNLYDNDGDPFKIISLYIKMENGIINEKLLFEFVESVNNQFLILSNYDFSDITYDFYTQLRINNSVGISLIDYDSEVTDYDLLFDSKTFTIYDQWNIVLVDYNDNDLTDDFYYKNLIIPYEQIIKEKVTPNNKTNIFNRNIMYKSNFDNHKDKRKISILK